MKNNIPILADVAGVILYLLMLPWLVQQFKTHSISNGIMITVFYIVFCASVYLLRVSISVNSPDSQPSKALLVFWSFFFSIMVFYMIFEFTGTLRFITDTSFAEQNEMMAGSRGTIIASTALVGFFVILLLYPVTMILKTRPLWSPDSMADVSIQALALLGVNLMIIVSMAQWEVAFQAESPYEGLGMGAKILIFGAVYLFFLVFYGSPRFAFYKANPSLLAVGTFIGQTGFYVWRFLDGSTWK